MVEIRPVPGSGNGRQLEPERVRQDLETGICQGVDRDHVTCVQCGHGRDGEAVLRPVDEHEPLVGSHLEPLPAEVAGHRGAVLRATDVGLVTKQRPDIARGRELAQGLAEQIGLPG